METVPRWTTTPHDDAWRKTTKLASVYALLALLATGLCLALREGSPWTYPDPWLKLGPVGRPAVSAVLGLGFALLLVVGTRHAVARYAWAQRLHADLRPFAKNLAPGSILLVAGLSSLGEELLFRALLVPLLGVPLAAVVFGLAHRINGPSRWVWAGWAFVAGLGLGTIFAATGSLVGPLLAHAVVNAANLAYVRDHDPTEA
jgi:membrane protease YdiL (CAAX protease family)